MGIFASLTRPSSHFWTGPGDEGTISQCMVAFTFHSLISPLHHPKFAASCRLSSLLQLVNLLYCGLCYCHDNTHAYIEKVKKDAPIVGLTLRENVLPTCLRTSDVFPTPADRQTDRQTDRQADRQKDRQTDRQTDKEKPNFTPVLLLSFGLVHTI